jgi:hypothetical protein
MGKKNANRVYRPNCSVCQYMKKNPDFKRACLQSTYFDPNGRESLMTVNERWGYPFKMPTMYRHMQRHQVQDIQRAEAFAKIEGKESKVWQRSTSQTLHKREAKEKELEKVDELLDNTVKVIEGEVLPSRQKHEVALDKFIALGEEEMRQGKLSITSSHLLNAIKIKADIEMRTKDRRLEMLKNMFTGAAPQKKDEN